jgi:hypothetical protein
MFDWEKAKVVLMEKPGGWLGEQVAEQKDLYNVVLAYYCWLHIRGDLKEDVGLLYTKTMYMYENWCTRLPIVYAETKGLIKEAYEQILKRFECDIVFHPSNSITNENITFYYDLARSKKNFLYTDIYKLLDYVYIMCDTYKVYDYDDDAL